MTQQPIVPIADPEYDVCLWPVDTACFNEEWENLGPEVQTRSLALATASLRRLTGYRVGGCPVTVRPCKPVCSDTGWNYSPGGFSPYINGNGRWVNSCGCRTDCACGALCEITLPGPIGEVYEVLVGDLDLTADTKVQGNRLIYTGDLECPFPSCQDLAAAPGEPGTFAVTYLNAFRVDGMGAYAAAILAMEFGKACSGGKNCRLPRGTTSVSRQGVTIEIAAGSFPGGVTGIQEVDAFIALWAPPGSPKWSPRIWTPTLRTPRVER